MGSFKKVERIDVAEAAIATLQERVHYLEVVVAHYLKSHLPANEQQQASPADGAEKIEAL